MVLRLWAGIQWCGTTVTRPRRVRECKLMQILGIKKGHKQVWAYAETDVSCITTVLIEISLLCLRM